jgi:type 2 lantibiotic biosynthesis protein LanM
VAKHSSHEKLIRSIASRATPLWERQIGDGQPQLERLKLKADQRLSRWRELLGDPRVFNKRLRCSRIPRRAIRNLLSGRQQSAELPGWAETLAIILRTCYASSTAHCETTDPLFAENKPFPFQEVLIGFLQHARESLKCEAAGTLEVLCGPAVAELERSLMSHLTFVASRTIGHDFYKFRFERAPASAIETVWSEQAPSTEIYSAYVRHMHEGGLLQLLDTYPVLGRLLAQLVEQWVHASADLCKRFFYDFEDLRRFFAWKVDQPLGAVTRLRTDLSDRHYGGRTVSECVLSTNEVVIYKPRTVQPEIAYYQFIDWLNRRGLSLDLKVIRALDRTTHGWVEFVPYSDCQTQEEVQRFYRRCGILTAVFYVLGTTDVHSENLIASGEHPVVVDLETLLSGSAKETQDQRLGSGENGPSVMSSGFLPQWQIASDGHKFDMSALAADDAQDPGTRFPIWQNINTDQMTFSETNAASDPLVHRVKLNGDFPPAMDHLPEILHGFKEAYSLLLSGRQELLANKKLLDEFDQLELRILVRGSVTYAEIHLHLLHPEFLKDGIDRSIELEWLARPLSATARPEKSRILLYETERAAMESLDIPHFSTSAWRDMEASPDDPDMYNLCGKRDSRVLRERLAYLSAADCAKQLAAIENAVRSRFNES